MPSITSSFDLFPPILPTLICVIIELSPGRTANSLVQFVLLVKQCLQVHRVEIKMTTVEISS